MLKDILKYALILMAVTLTASGALAVVYQMTAPKILEEKQKELEKGLFYVLPGTESGVIVAPDSGTIYLGFRHPDTTGFIGYAYSAFAKGYSSTIWTLAGIDTNGTILRISIIDQKETPGLGTRCNEVKSGESEPWWQAQFKNKYAPGLAVDKDRGEIVSITGATITSRAITNAVARESSVVIKRFADDQE